MIQSFIRSSKNFTRPLQSRIMLIHTSWLASEIQHISWSQFYFFGNLCVRIFLCSRSRGCIKVTRDHLKNNMPSQTISKCFMAFRINQGQGKWQTYCFLQQPYMKLPLTDRHLLSNQTADAENPSTAKRTRTLSCLARSIPWELGRRRQTACRTENRFAFPVRFSVVVKVWSKLVATQVHTQVKMTLEGRA